MKTPTRSPSETSPSNRLSPRSGPCRRRVLSAVAAAGASGLAGCMNILSSEDRRNEPPSAEVSITNTPDEGLISPTPSDSLSVSSTNTDDQSTDEASTPAIQTDGPVDSSSRNDAPYDDPVDGLALSGVTVRMGEERQRDSMLRLDDQLSVDIEGTRFEIRGRGHIEWECDTIRLRTVIVDGRHARVYAETREVDSCRTPDNPAGLGPWAISFSITGRFEGGRPDALTASIQGPFIHDSGVFVTEPL